MKKFLLLSYLFFSLNCYSQVCSLGNSFNGSINVLTIDNSGNVYAAGDFTDPNGKYYVAKWNGTTWSELGTGSNTLYANNSINAIVIDKQGNVYATVDSTDSNYDDYNYVAKWNGSKWSKLGPDTIFNNNIQTLAIDASGNIYAAGDFTDTSVSQNYVAKWNGSTWSKLGTGSNVLNATDYISKLVIDKQGNVYAVGGFQDATDNYYVAKWDGTTWSEVGAANPLDPNDLINAIMVDDSSNVYAGGDFGDASNHFYVAKWNGTEWSELGTGSNALPPQGPIYALASDKMGNVYAAGGYTDGVGVVHGFLSIWNGQIWLSIDSVQSNFTPNGLINILTTDSVGNLYAAGSFTDNIDKEYVAKLPLAQISAYSLTGCKVVLNADANKATGLVYQWYNGSTAIANAIASSYTASATGTYSVTVKSGSNCTITSQSVSATVMPLSVVINTSNVSSLCSDVILNAALTPD